MTVYNFIPSNQFLKQFWLSYFFVDFPSSHILFSKFRTIRSSPPRISRGYRPQEICVLQKILQMEWQAAMVDCGLLNKQHCVRRTVCWTQAPSVYFLFCPTNQPTCMRGKAMGNKTLYGDGHGSCVSPWDQNIHKNRVHYCREQTFTVLTR